MTRDETRRILRANWNQLQQLLGRGIDLGASGLQPALRQQVAKEAIRVA